MEISKSNNSRVSTSARQAEGGAILITAGQNLELMNGATVLAESSGSGNSGTVTLEAVGGNFQSDKQHRLHDSSTSSRGATLSSLLIKMWI